MTFSEIKLLSPLSTTKTTVVKTLKGKEKNDEPNSELVLQVFTFLRLLMVTINLIIVCTHKVRLASEKYT